MNDCGLMDAFNDLNNESKQIIYDTMKDVLNKVNSSELIKKKHSYLAGR